MFVAFGDSQINEIEYKNLRSINNSQFIKPAKTNINFFRNKKNYATTISKTYRLILIQKHYLPGRGLVKKLPFSKFPTFITELEVGLSGLLPVLAIVVTYQQLNIKTLELTFI
jgi:hypothetical protein